MKNTTVADSKKIARRKKGVVKAKSDFFRTARYGLTLQEHRIIYYAILAGQQDGKPFDPVTLSIGEFKELFEVSGKNYYGELRKLSKKLIGKSVEIVTRNEDGPHLMQAAWLSSITYHVKEGTVTISPNKDLKPFFEGKPFTTTEYYFLIRFTSQYAERLYELLKSMPFYKKPIIDFDIEEIAQRLAVPVSYRKNYTDFKRFALDPAIKDINEYTDLDVSIREKRGQYNKVSTVYFSVMQKNVPKLADRVERGEFTPPLSEDEQEIVMRELLGEDGPGEDVPGQLALDGSEVV